MNKKGFTLVELLTIIAILAVIALITTPIVTNVIESSKKGIFKESANGLVKSTKLYYSEQVEDEDFKGKVFDFSGNTDELPYKGKKPVAGKIVINDEGLIEINVTDGTYCASKSLNSNEVVVTKGTECVKDYAESEITITAVNETSKRVVVKASCTTTANVSIKNYQFKLGDGEWLTTTNDYYIFDDLEANKEYTVSAKCLNSIGRITEGSTTVKTSVINAPVISITPTTEYAQQRTVKIDYPEGRYKYQYSTDGINWHEATDGESITFSSESDNGTTIMAKMTDSKNVVNATNMVVSGIDTTKPVISKDLNEGSYNQLKSVKVSTSDSNYDYMTIEVLKNGVKDTTKSLSKVTGTYSVISLDSYAVWTINVTSYDKAGNSTTASYVYTLDSTLSLGPTVKYNLDQGYYNSDKTVTVTATADDFSYMKVHVYKNGTIVSYNNNITTKTYSPTLDAEGTWVVYTQAYDIDGNKQVQSPDNGSGWYYQQYTIDKTLPTVSYNIAGGTYNAKKTVTISGADTNFSYMRVHIYKNGTFVSAKSNNSITATTYNVALDSDGTWVVYTQVYDKAGNKHSKSPDNGSGWYYQQYVIDTTAPSCTNVAKKGSSSGDTYTSGSWTAGNVYTTATCSDTLSGCSSTKKVTTTGATANHTNATKSTYTVKAKGKSTVTWTVYDKAGNSKKCSTITIKKGEKSRDSSCGTESYTYSCTKTCTLTSTYAQKCGQLGGNFTQASGQGNGTCKYPCASTCKGTRYKECWHY